MNTLITSCYQRLYKTFMHVSVTICEYYYHLLLSTFVRLTWMFSVTICEYYYHFLLSNVCIGLTWMFQSQYVNTIITSCYQRLYRLTWMSQSKYVNTIITSCYQRLYRLRWMFQLQYVNTLITSCYQRLYRLIWMFQPQYDYVVRQRGVNTYAVELPRFCMIEELQACSKPIIHFENYWKKILQPKYMIIW